jgi:hypothetical protein
MLSSTEAVHALETYQQDAYRTKCLLSSTGKQARYHVTGDCIGCFV